ncbi:5570_t:CDS:2 [Acaulospora colombiana]|uniref:5570_t:CDS:1 n=1 Tax=Acaulospora colombiana TaxID=27376 RepID=A0ACA9MDQ0_9GLOM|nr:5570_t:CDS:2 [Acaulospora colombiana]
MVAYVYRKIEPDFNCPAEREGEWKRTMGQGMQSRSTTGVDIHKGEHERNEASVVFTVQIFRGAMYSESPVRRGSLGNPWPRGSLLLKIRTLGGDRHKNGPPGSYDHSPSIEANAATHTYTHPLDQKDNNLLQGSTFKPEAGDGRWTG